MTYGDALSVYGKELPECEGHEWDNRTVEENNQWLHDNGVDPLRRTRVFCASLSDVFEDWQGPMVDSKGNRLWHSPCGVISADPGQPLGGVDGPVTMSDVRQRLFDMIDATPNLDWLLLTKRPENILKMWPDKKGDYIPEAGMMNRPSHRNNCWLGCSVENQEYAEKRIPELLKFRDLAPVLFLSCEPLLGQVDLSVPWEGEQESPTLQVDLVIAGGESGPGARPSHPYWLKSIRDQCSDADVPFHFKQWGEYGPCKNFDREDMCDVRIDIDGRDVTKLDELHCETDAFMDRDGVKKTGRMLDGVLHNEFPKVQA